MDKENGLQKYWPQFVLMVLSLHTCGQFNFAVLGILITHCLVLGGTAHVVKGSSAAMGTF